MISGKFIEDLPRIGTTDVRRLLPEKADEVELELDVDMEGQHLVQLVLLTATPLPRRGGLRWWWRCPACGQRRTHLYLAETVRCRSCTGAGYLSQYG